MKTLEDALKAGKLLLRENNIVDSEVDAWYLFSYYFKMNRASFFMQSSMEIRSDQYQEYLELVQKRANHIPLQYITGEQEFMGLNFHVTKDVLIPRQDTEILVDEVLKVAEGKEVLDVCTGSGCIIISLAKLCKLAKGVGTDISEDALKVAGENAKQLQADVTFLISNMYDKIEDKYDIIVSNPPYIPTADIMDLMEEVKTYEPRLALDGKTDGLYFYRILIHGLNQHLKPNGYVFFEIGYNQGEAVCTLLKEAGITDIRIVKDLAGLDRVICGRFLKAEEPFT